MAELHPSLEWVDCCCVTCRRERHITVWAADFESCSHGKICAWGEAKYDGSCSPIGSPSKMLDGRSDPPLQLSGPTLLEMIQERQLSPRRRKTA
jgi:hypothetical protein